MTGKRAPRPVEADPGTVRPASPETATAPLGPKPQELAPAETQLAPEPPVRLPVPARGKRRGLLRVFGWSLALFAVATIGFELWQFLARAFETSFAVGTALAALVALATGTGVAVILREISSFGREMRKLREVESLTSRAAALIAADGAEGGRGDGRALALAARIVEPYSLRPELAGAIERFRASANTAHSNRQVLELLTETVVRPLDRQAYSAVGRAAKDAGVGVALSPSGLLDAGLVVWRTLRLVREVAAIYGFRPGFFARMRLVQRILGNAATAGAGGFVADAMLAHAGARLGGLLLSVWAGEGMLTAARTARMGLLTMEACRPVPFGEADRASIARLTRELSAQLGRKDDA